MDNRQESVSKGQAMNLAMEIAVKEGKHNDNKFIVNEFVRIFKLITYVQTHSLEEIIKKLGK